MPIYERIIVRLFPGYLPSVIDLTNLTNRAYFDGRTDYVVGLPPVTNFLQFAIQSIYRMLYFWISPTPRFWTSVMDIAGFFMDTIPWMAVFYWLLKNRKKSNPQSKAIWFVLLVYTITYGWGTQNAGTAMRHRDLLLGIVVMAVLIALKSGRCRGGYYFAHPTKEIHNEQNDKKAETHIYSSL